MPTVGTYYLATQSAVFNILPFPIILYFLPISTLSLHPYIHTYHILVFNGMEWHIRSSQLASNINTTQHSYSK